MQNFEQIRSHLLASGYKLTLQDPFVVCVELSLAKGKRHQAIFLSEMQDDDDRCYLRVSTAIAPTWAIASTMSRSPWSGWTDPPGKGSRD